MAENVQTFINMAYLQQIFSQEDLHNFTEEEKVQIRLEPGKRLLLLDMDETLIHAATLNDIFGSKIYGNEANPDFLTSFYDEETEI